MAKMFMDAHESKVETKIDPGKHFIEEIMPCFNCAVKDFCKYCNIIKRPDYPLDIFTMTIKCSIQEKGNTKLKTHLNSQIRGDLKDDFI